MPQRDTSGIGARLPRELIGADFAVAFNLVEMANDESQRENGQLASQLLQKAEGMLDDIERRMQRMTAEQKEEFAPRCAELREAIGVGRTPDAE